MGEDSSDDDLDLMERARILSEATGRDVADVLADLADDGILNDSHKPDSKDLISELQEAAKLIGAVQQINRAAAENTVLNGGENKTEVTVETTLEGDIVDRAIENLTIKAQNIKKLALIVAPVLLLITGGTMNGLGVFDGSNDAPDDSYEYHDEGYGGCTAWDAENYDSYASWDDGTCYWDNTPPPSDCESNFGWHDSYNIIGENDIRAYGVFQDFNNCPVQEDNDAQFIATINKDGQFHDEFKWDNRFGDRWEADWLWSDLSEGEYDVEWNALMGGSNWHWNVNERLTVESEECTPDLESSGSWAQTVHNESSNIEVHIEVNNLNPDCPVQIEVMVSVYLNNSYQFTMESDELGRHWVYDEAKIKIRDSRLDNLGDGDWSFETRYIPVGGYEDCCQMTNVVTISSEPDEPDCVGNAFFYSVNTEQQENNGSNNLTVYWDADWSCDELQEVQIDIILKSNGTIVYSRTVAYNLNGSMGYVATHALDYELQSGQEYDLCLSVWVEREQWNMDDEDSRIVAVS
tara:strand:+ start:1475 stop:3037 length:1563 start_codon:yes stop_codon:yes gene_type:complete